VVVVVALAGVAMVAAEAAMAAAMVVATKAIVLEGARMPFKSALTIKIYLK
jgi:hypothetical protein